MSRSRDRVKTIDSVTRAELPEHGHEYVAERLGEDPKYILQRAYHLKVKRNRPEKVIKPKQPTKADLGKRIQTLEEQNKALRLELIKFTDQRRKAS